jgi:hypothetical protein
MFLWGAVCFEHCKEKKKISNEGTSALRYWDFHYRNLLLKQGNLT